MGKKKKMKVSKYELFETRLAELENRLMHKDDLLQDLIDYLMRVDPNFKNEPSSFQSWYSRLMKMRDDDDKRKNCAKAQRLLEDEGYIVAVDENSFDAARLKKWLHEPRIINQGSKPTKDDDDIPF